MVPPKSKFVAYYRVSTENQRRSGLGLDAQKADVNAFLKAHAGVLVDSFIEMESGKVADRPQLIAALKRCRLARATLLVAKLDRLSRNIAFLFNLRDAGVKFQALDLPEANTLTLGVMAAMAQHEREVISARTKAALAARKARGFTLGTPRDLSAYQRRAAAQGTATLKGMAAAFAKDIAADIEQAKAEGCTTLQSIADYLTTKGITTRRGKANWTATAVRNAMALLAE